MAPQANSLHGRILPGNQPPPIGRYSIAELDRGLYCVIDRDGYAVTDQDHADPLDAEAELAFLEEEDAETEGRARLTIITTHVYPPIPDRRFDWTAHYEGFEEGPYGCGRTEQEAIADLRDNYDEPEAA